MDMCIERRKVTFASYQELLFFSMLLALLEVKGMMYTATPISIKLGETEPVQIYWCGGIQKVSCGYSIVVIRDLPKVKRRVRFPLPAPFFY